MKVFYVPESAFKRDIKKCITGSTNYSKNKKRQKIFYLLSAFWILLNDDCFGFHKDKSGGTWIATELIKNSLDRKFIEVFNNLCKLNNKRYINKCSMQFFQTLGGLLLKNQHYYKINMCSGIRGQHMQLTAIQEGTEDYNQINSILIRVQKHLDNSRKSGRKNLRKSEDEISKRYYEMTIDEGKAVSALEERYGISFADALHYNSLDSKSKNKNVLLKCHKANLFYQQYNQLKNFNRQYYGVTAKFGRIYTGLHNLARDVRNYLCDNKNEKMVEVYDMHGAHVVGWFAMCSSYEKRNGNSALSDVYTNYIMNAENDPYRFAMKGVFENKRSTVKMAVLSYVFAGYADCKYRGSFIARMKKEGNYNQMLSFCEAFNSIRESFDVLSMPNDMMKSVFSDVMITPDIYFVLTGKRINKLTFYNCCGKYKSISSTGAQYDINRGFIDLSVFCNLVDVAYKSMLQYHVEKCLEDEFGSSSISTCMSVKQYFRDKSRGIKDYIMSVLGFKNRKNLSECSTPNASIMCQISEGWTMFDNIIPELEEKLGCKEIITLHDAILVPEGVVDKINVKELNKNVMQIFIANVEYAFNHITEYFKGDIDAPFSYKSETI